jgi:localization factor PodJL
VLSQLAETRASQPAEAFDPARDTMPADPDVEAPLVDRGPAADIPLVPPQPARTKKAQPVVTPPDLEDAQRPPKPVSSFAEPGFDPFAESVPAAAAPAAQAEVTTRNSAQSTFIAAARRAQLARQSEAAPATNSLIGRALARVMPQKPAEPEADLAGAVPVAATPAPAAVEPEAPAEPKARRWSRKPKPVAEEPVATREPVADPVVAVQPDMVA